MATYVIFDTCIYRQLGIKFQDNLDYRNFCGFLVATDNEMLVSEIVVKEFVGFYSKQLENKISNYQNSINNLIRDPFIDTDTLKVKSLEKAKNHAIEKFREAILNDPNHGHPFARIQTVDIPSLNLVDFIIDSNNKGIKNLQIRDFLIWVSLLNFALEVNEDRHVKIGDEERTFEACDIAFITNDSGFSENELFKIEKNKYKIDNLEIYNSIPQFLNRLGYNLPFVNKELIITCITNEDIKQGLLSDSGCFLSYISPRYNSEICMDRKIVEFKVNNYEIIEFYSFIENTKYKYVAHLKVFPEIIYECDEDLHTFYKYIENLDSNKSFYLESYDSQNRPIFKVPILYMISGDLDTEKMTIKTKELIDFIPDRYIRYE